MSNLTAHYVCDNKHATSTPVINGRVTDDGLSGYTGSAADFCDVCDSPRMTMVRIVNHDTGDEYMVVTA